MGYCCPLCPVSIPATKQHIYDCQLYIYRYSGRTGVARRSINVLSAIVYFMVHAVYCIECTCVRSLFVYYHPGKDECRVSHHQTTLPSPTAASPAPRCCSTHLQTPVLHSPGTTGVAVAVRIATVRCNALPTSRSPDGTITAAECKAPPPPPNRPVTDVFISCIVAYLLVVWPINSFTFSRGAWLETFYFFSRASMMDLMKGGFLSCGVQRIPQMVPTEAFAFHVRRLNDLLTGYDIW